MKCRHYFSFVLVAFLSLFFGSFITINDTSAVDDYTVTLDWANFNSLELCGSNSGRSCSDYFYFISEPIGTCNGNNPNYVVFGFGNVNNSISVCNKVVMPFDSTVTSLFVTGGRSLPDRYFGNINVTLSSNYGFSPSGDISITSNGIYDVSSYATATVDVPSEVIQGDYHDDLVNIQNAIITCGAILLVLYFFYCIYRLIIKNSGVH